jgi:hypothetical protein
MTISRIDYQSISECVVCEFVENLRENLITTTTKHRKHNINNDDEKFCVFVEWRRLRVDDYNNKFSWGLENYYTFFLRFLLLLPHIFGSVLLLGTTRKKSSGFIIPSFRVLA